MALQATPLLGDPEIAKTCPRSQDTRAHFQTSVMLDWIGSGARGTLLRATSNTRTPTLIRPDIQLPLGGG